MYLTYKQNYKACRGDLLAGALVLRVAQFCCCCCQWCCWPCRFLCAGVCWPRAIGWPCGAVGLSPFLLCVPQGLVPWCHSWSVMPLLFGRSTIRGLVWRFHVAGLSFGLAEPVVVARLVVFRVSHMLSAICLLPAGFRCSHLCPGLGADF